MNILGPLIALAYIAAAIYTGIRSVQYDLHRFVRTEAYEAGYIFLMGTIFAPIVWIGIAIKALVKE